MAGVDGNHELSSFTYTVLDGFELDVKLVVGEMFVPFVLVTIKFSCVKWYESLGVPTLVTLDINHLLSMSREVDEHFVTLFAPGC